MINTTVKAINVRTGSTAKAATSATAANAFRAGSFKLASLALIAVRSKNLDLVISVMRASQEAGLFIIDVTFMGEGGLV